MQLFSLEILVFVAHFLNAVWHGKEIFPKSSSQNEIVLLLIVFHLPYSKYKGVKICFYSCRYKIKMFRSCRTRVVRVAFVSHLCRTSVALVLHWCRSCRTRVARVWHLCCKLDQIRKLTENGRLLLLTTFTAKYELVLVLTTLTWKNLCFTEFSTKIN